MHGRRITRISGGRIVGRDCGVSGADNRFQGFPFMRHILFHHFHQVGDQVVTPFELDIDLGERVFIAVSEGNQTVVYGDQPEHNNGDNTKEN